MKQTATKVDASVELKMHQWAATGVSGYPLSHPIVGQSQFYDTFRRFIHIVDAEQEGFAHVFAVVAPWGVGKSRLGYELVAQINDSSRGWYVRDDAGDLKDAELFYDDADREQYLALYLRYSQIATEYQNVDNWFGYGLYKALLPLTRDTFDNSIQGQVAKQAYDRLLVNGFEAGKLGEALEISAKHTDEHLYEDPSLVTRLCEQAYKYVSGLGIKYLLITLDELETAAEAATYGLEREDLKYLDGRAIKLLGKAIKEEDPRRKLPWLRYVALCSPAIGDELRELQSTARRFELVDLSSNSFADVSDFVDRLRSEGRLREKYLPGLVEAAYTMSAGNFGWFNVIMANVDGILSDPKLQGKNAPSTIGDVFENAVRTSNRLREHVLDHNALNELKIAKTNLPAAKDLIYGQLPVPLKPFTPEQREALLSGKNEFDEPICMLFVRLEWDEKSCADALRAAKATRDKGRWRLPGVDEPLDLRQLLANLGTYSIHETQGKTAEPGKHVVLIPLAQSDFVQLVEMLYPHPASEDVARALWASLVIEERLPATSASFIGPSVDMLGRLNLRYRKQAQNTLIFRDPDESAALERALEGCKGQKEDERNKQVLTGIMRSVDDNWDYDPVGADLKIGIPAIATQVARGRGTDGGLLRFDAMKLHPDRRLILAYVRSEEELLHLVDAAAIQFADEGRTPVLAFTGSRTLSDRFANAASGKLKHAQEFLLLYWLNHNEEQLLQQIGLPKAMAKQFAPRPEKFSTAFSNRLQSLLRSLKSECHRWRRKLNDAGRMAWPFRPGGTLPQEDRDLIIRTWKQLLIGRDRVRRLHELDSGDLISAADALAVVHKLNTSARAASAGYGSDEQAGLFDTLDESAEPRVPAFMVRLVKYLQENRDKSISLPQARVEWFWGYIWEGNRPAETFEQWMALLWHLGYAEPAAPTGKGDRRYALVERKQIRAEKEEATNWLNKDYPKIVDNMEVVFGEGKVRDYFAPLSAAKPGSKTIDAKNRLQKAAQLLDELDVVEATFNPDVNKIALGARLRTNAREVIRYVYDNGEYQRQASDENVKTLNFEDDTRPLWERVHRADLFAKQALEFKARICGQIDDVASEMEGSVKRWPRFPLALFTRSLAKIKNILEGALEIKEAQGTTQKLQVKEAGTLKWYLRDLKIAEAYTKLQQLAREVGLDSARAAPRKLEEIDGQIAVGFRDLQASYAQLHDRLQSQDLRVAALSCILADAPSDFEYPKEIPAFDALQRFPEEIRSELEESIFDDIETLFEEHDRPAQLGNFQPLMAAAKDLLRSPTVTLNRFAGFIATLDNKVADYLKRLMQNSDLQQVAVALNALRKTRGLAPHKPIDYSEMEAAGSLKLAKKLVEERQISWVEEGEGILKTAGVSFTRWKGIVQAVNCNRDPELSDSEAAQLLSANFLRRSYTLGGAE